MRAHISHIGAAALLLFTGVVPVRAANELFSWVTTDTFPRTSRLVKLNPRTGGRATVGDAGADCCIVSIGSSALDPDGGRLFFMGRYRSEPATDPVRLFAIATSTGKILSDPRLAPGNWNFLEWDPLRSKLFGVVFEGGTESLYEIDPSTGIRTAIGSGIADCCVVPPGVSTLDAAGGRLYFAGQFPTDPFSVVRLFTLDVESGLWVDDTPPVLPAGRAYPALEWDSTTGTLYAFARLSAIGSTEVNTEVLKIDPATGTTSSTGIVMPQCCSTGFRIASLHPATRRLFFVGRPFAEAAPRLFTFDLTSGSIVSNPPLSSSEGYYAVEFSVRSH